MEPLPASPVLPCPADLQQWVRFIAGLNLPVLRHTASSMIGLAENIEVVDPRAIADTVLSDPLMTLKVFAWSASVRSKRQVTDLETIEPILLMSGMESFFRYFETLETIEARLAGQPRALAGLLRAVSRAYRASAYARDWALRRRDLDTEVILIAALLHDFAELLMWLYVPEQALEIEERQRANPQLRSADAQRAVLGVRLADVEYELVRAWRLPELLISMMDDRHAEHPRVRNVVFAVNLARHSARGWDNPALPDDFVDIARLLNLSVDYVREMLVPAELLPGWLAREQAASEGAEKDATLDAP